MLSCVFRLVNPSTHFAYRSRSDVFLDLKFLQNTLGMLADSVTVLASASHALVAEHHSQGGILLKSHLAS